METKCKVCPRGCSLKEGETGFCGGRICKDNEVVSKNYGEVTVIALDFIEKNPLRRFCPSRTILTVGSYGCNLRCPFCETHEIAMGGPEQKKYTVTPEFLEKRVKEMRGARNVGLCHSYNEPLISYEFVRDCAEAVKPTGMNNVVITNGYINEEPLMEILPLIQAWNIDLKSFSPDFYKEIGGDLEVVKRNIEIVDKEGAHLEINCVIVPDMNDDPDEMTEMVDWIYSIDPELPLHISRFIPAYKMEDREETDVETLEKLIGIARKKLKYVYPGNLKSWEHRF